MFRASALVTEIGLLLFNQQFHQSKYQGVDIEFPTKCYAVNAFSMAKQNIFLAIEI